MVRQVYMNDGGFLINLNVLEVTWRRERSWYMSNFVTFGLSYVLFTSANITDYFPLLFGQVCFCL